jgi:hypothetical protein
MATTERELADLRSLVAPMASATSRLSNDSELAGRLIDAVHQGDSENVSRLFEETGVSGVTHRRDNERPIPGTTGVREVLSYSPNERWQIEIIIVIDGKP